MRSSSRSLRARQGRRRPSASTATGRSSASRTSSAAGSTTQSRPSELLAALTRTSAVRQGAGLRTSHQAVDDVGMFVDEPVQGGRDRSGDAERSARLWSASGTGGRSGRSRCRPGVLRVTAWPSPQHARRGPGGVPVRFRPCPTCVWRCASSTPSWARWTATPSASSTCLARVEAQGADVAAFPELAITGYPPEDLLLKPAFVAHNLAALEKVARPPPTCVALVGFVDVVGTRTSTTPWPMPRVPVRWPERPPSEARPAVFATPWRCVSAGSVLGVYHKRRLPNYGVFDEERWFAPGYDRSRALRGRRHARRCVDL